MHPSENASQGYDHPRPVEGFTVNEHTMWGNAVELTKDNFRCTVVASRYYCGVVLFLKRSAPEVDKTYIRVVQNSFGPHRRAALEVRRAIDE